MEKRLHTPGPWIIRENGRDVEAKHLKYNSLIACSYKMNGYKKDGEGKYIDCEIAIANARLISAAPELLDLAFQFRELVNTMDNGNSPIAKQIQLTIDKALGNSEQDV